MNNFPGEAQLDISTERTPDRKDCNGIAAPVSGSAKMAAI